MYEKFTDRAREAMKLAEQEARQFCYGYIGVKHVIIGLMRADGVAAEVMRSRGVTDADMVREYIDKRVAKGASMSTAGRLPQSPRVERVIKYAMEEAARKNNKYVGTGHMLLALVRESWDADSSTTSLFLDFGLTYRAIATLLDNLAVGPEEKISQSSAGVPVDQQEDDAASRLLEADRLLRDMHNLLYSRWVIGTLGQELREKDRQQAADLIMRYKQYLGQGHIVEIWQFNAGAQGGCAQVDTIMVEVKAETYIGPGVDGCTSSCVEARTYYPVEYRGKVYSARKPEGLRRNFCVSLPGPPHMDHIRPDVFSNSKS